MHRPHQPRFTKGRPVIRIAFHQKLLSYLQAVSLKRSRSDISGCLELLLYRNQFQLLTEGAFYSDGDRYYPAVAVAKHLKEFLPAVKSVLVLGAGLGSIVHVMRARGYDPRCTLVEKDKTVLRWALEILGEGDARKIEPVCRDAESFMAQNERKYDLVFVDVFKGRAVPDFVTTPLFLMQCRDSLSPGGRLALNYIEVDKHEWEKARTVLAGVFPACQVVSKDDNRILITSPSPSPEIPGPPRG
jgi:spermidine synthase